MFIAGAESYAVLQAVAIIPTHGNDNRFTQRCRDSYFVTFFPNES